MKAEWIIEAERRRKKESDSKWRALNSKYTNYRERKRNRKKLNRK